MNNSPTYKIAITNFFKKQLKGLIKKDKTLMENLKKELQTFSKERAIFIKSKVYKIRIKNQARGKSSGYRVYVLLVEINNLLAPACIYSKKDKINLTTEELAYCIAKTNAELELL